MNQTNYPQYQIYNNFFDLDLYTLNMCFVVLNEFPRACTKWEFFDRGNTIYPKGFADELRKQINGFANIKPSQDEVDFIREKLYYLPEWFFQFLTSYKYDPSEVIINQDEDGHLSVSIEGLWWKTIFWEQPILETISEMWHFTQGNLDKISNEDAFLDGYNKASFLINNNIKFSEFGCRRRASYNLHKEVLRGMCHARNTIDNGNKCFIGTSDIHLAYVAKKEFDCDLTICGTMAHSYVTNIAALYGPMEANSLAMDLWRKHFKCSLGIFLPDGISLNGFMTNFSKENAKSFDGLRHDSGNEEEITDLFVAKYKELGVNPMHKSIIYSNGFTDMNRVIEVNNYAKQFVQPSFGLGGFFTCNFMDNEGNKKFKGLNIVIKSVAVKMTEKREFNHVVKIPFDMNKAIGDKQTIDIYNFMLHN